LKNEHIHPQAASTVHRLAKRSESLSRVPTIGERARLGKSQTSLRSAANALLDWQPAATQVPPSTLLTSVKPALISTSAAKAERARREAEVLEPATNSAAPPPPRGGLTLPGTTPAPTSARCGSLCSRSARFRATCTPLRVVGRLICADVAASLSLREGARGSWRRRGRGAAERSVPPSSCGATVPRRVRTRLRAPAHSCGCLAVGRGCCFGTPVTEAAPATQPLTPRRIIARRGVFGTAARSADDG